MEERVEPNSITYWEERTINIGDYESRKIGLSLSTKVIDINVIDKKLVISSSDSIKFYKKSDMDSAINEAVSTVKNVLDENEKKIRTEVQRFVADSLIEKGRHLFNIPLEEDFISDVEEVKEKRRAKTFDDEDFDDFEDDEKPLKKSNKQRNFKKEIEEEFIFEEDEEDKKTRLKEAKRATAKYSRNN